MTKLDRIREVVDRKATAIGGDSTYFKECYGEIKQILEEEECTCIKKVRDVFISKEDPDCKVHGSYAKKKKALEDWQEKEWDKLGGKPRFKKPSERIRDRAKEKLSDIADWPRSDPPETAIWIQSILDYLDEQAR